MTTENDQPTCPTIIGIDTTTNRAGIKPRTVKITATFQTPAATNVAELIKDACAALNSLGTPKTQAPVKQARIVHIPELPTTEEETAVRKVFGPPTREEEAAVRKQFEEPTLADLISPEDVPSGEVWLVKHLDYTGQWVGTRNEATGGPIWSLAHTETTRTRFAHDHEITLVSLLVPEVKP